MKMGGGGLARVGVKSAGSSLTAVIPQFGTVWVLLVLHRRREP